MLMFSKISVVFTQTCHLNIKQIVMLLLNHAFSPSPTLLRPLYFFFVSRKICYNTRHVGVWESLDPASVGSVRGLPFGDSGHSSDS